MSNIPGICKSCGAAIIWVRTAKSFMPLDPALIPVQPDPQGTVWAIKENGEMIRGNKVSVSCEGGYVLARVSHFATCPNANQHRRISR